MKLSDAIRLGATISRQIFMQYQDDADGTCALGGALLAVGKPARESSFPISVAYEAIADFVETIERQYEPTTERPVERNEEVFA